MSQHEAMEYARGASRLQEQGRLAEAVEAYRHAVSLMPDSAELACNLGVSLAATRQWSDACDAYRLALRLRPDFPEVACNLGNALKELGRIDEAIQSYGHAAELRPGFAAAYFNLGNTYYSTGEHERAVEAFEKALAIRPNYAKAANNLGNALRALGRLEAARMAYTAATRSKPDYSAAQGNLALIAFREGKPQEALRALEEVLAAHPNEADVHVNMGAVLTELECYDQALAHFGRAAELAPDFADPRFQRGVIHLLLGNLGRGFADYEWRQHLRGKSWVTYRQPRWEGASLAGRTILLHAEQGAGDVLQFILYAPLVKRYGGTNIIGCYPSLLRLLSRAPGVDRIVKTGDPLPEFDVQAALGSLPDIFGTMLSTIPAEVPYLFAEPELKEVWKREVAVEGKFRVGLAWQGNPEHARDQLRSMSLQLLLPLTNVPGVQYYSLQKGFGSEQLAGLEAPVAISDWGNRFEDYADAAAAISNLDLIICVDTSMAHLAGALGLPTWILLSKVPDWRWLLEGDHSPWYPTARLFRQTEPGRWDRVVTRVREALIDAVAAAQQRASGMERAGVGRGRV